jgi:N-acyl-D-amino-acid deacylase
VLGHYVRELKLIPLEGRFAMMTSMPATAFRFKDRGLLREGFAADIVIFDPEKVIDKATFEKPHQFAQGSTTMIVSGGVVMEGRQADRHPQRYGDRGAGSFIAVDFSYGTRSC